MDLYRTLFEIAELLLAEDDPERTAEEILRCLLAATEAERGFIVVREGESYEQKFHVRYDRGSLSPAERRFSRSLVRHVLETGTLFDSSNLAADPHFGKLASVQGLGPCALLAVPLGSREEPSGVLVLERPGATVRFGETARTLVTRIAGPAGLLLDRALARQALRRRNESLERDVLAKHRFSGIVTQHPKMLELLQLVVQLADSDAPVLIRGETGTGKELIAQALHLNGRRRNRPFVALHCAALGASVLESELFGHVRGAFTDAKTERKGRLAAADGGTLLLDEIAEIPVEVQAKLLRFLQFGEIQRLGSDRVERVDVRVLAATHQDLAALVSGGRFRQDLYFRLKVVPIEIPPLRERKGDVSLLLDHFLRKQQRAGGLPLRFSRRAEQALLRYTWPGNVRELEHVVHRACVLASGPELGIELLPPEVRAPAPSEPAILELTGEALQAAKERATAEVERRFLGALLERHGGNVSRAAREAGIPRRQLQRLLSRQARGQPSR